MPVVFLFFFPLTSGRARIQIHVCCSKAFGLAPCLLTWKLRQGSIPELLHGRETVAATSLAPRSSALTRGFDVLDWAPSEADPAAGIWVQVFYLGAE